MGAYKSFHFYHPRLGELLGKQYKVLGKFGFGTFSTVWFCKDIVYLRLVITFSGTRG